MIIIIALFIIGIFIGYLFKNRKKIIECSEKATNITIYALLFTLGLSVGSNKEVLSNLDKIGLQSLIISFLAIFGSIAASYILFKNFFIKNEK